MAISEKPRALKRKKSIGADGRKRPRLERTAEELPWKKSHRPLETGLGGDDGILELEEVAGVEVVYEMTQGGKLAKFCVSQVRCGYLQAVR